MFSPYYAFSGWAEPLDHCAVNVALYGPAGKRWAMTERRRPALRRDRNNLAIGPSRLAWEGDALIVSFAEVTAPLPSRIAGTVRLRPKGLNRQAFALDADGRHVWQPIAPRADVEVSLDNPAGSWRGEGYFDTNAGAEPLEDGFAAWDWSRTHLPRETLLFYDVQARDGERGHLALRCAVDGALVSIEPPTRTRLPPTLWRMPRSARGEGARVRRTLEDTPFYARSQLDGCFGGERAETIHESLSLDRLRSPIVRAMLPFRMPRVFW